MTTLVPTSEEDPALSVVRFTSEISWADAGPEVAEPQVSRLCLEASECMLAGRWLDLTSLMLTSADVIFSKASDKDLECIFTVICNLVKKTGSLDEALEMAKLISTKVTQQPNDKPALRLKIMFNLYNLLENPYSRFFVYMKALNLAVNGKVIEHVVPSFKKIDSFLKEWNLGVQDQRELFLSVSNILKESKSSAKDSFKFLTKYLATFSDEDAQNMAEAKEEAVRAVVEFVKTPDMFQCDLLDMPAVAQLEKDAKYESVYQLLKIFLTQKLDAYLEFHSANSSLLKNYGILHEDCVAKMRLMSLVDLGANESGHIPYDLIKHTLQIADDEVEGWVVKAITAKLLDCKIDQMNQIIIVSRCTERVFGLNQWQSLRTKLATWRGNISNVIATIQANKVAEDGAQLMQGLAIH
ncbi:hypothetical protein DCAR_0312522 [Daucus carota subsp. sativus]|uniref:Eukaryotic translation initiation factor 3 subunit M n=1 Tax=Daucus carota subsp. sativus TaxID=79200 RepID=A0AAF1AUR9_DAUCS|nr:PREDICTED: eukaryotic translation initiation factor 3 subunit M-like [Daucus carota subsp. sativus]WOG93241.1 hypothetical protein DCAR_0312522 [Daucus carota subsp. sativus]